MSIGIGIALALVLASPQGAKRLYQPEDVDGPSWLEIRRKAQIDSAAGLDAFHRFRFEDRVEESGITFRNRVTDDSTKHFKAVHYDHGNGIAIADVDADGRLDIYFTSQTGPNELWRNLGGGRFENVTERAGVALSGLISVTGSFGDIDNDSDPDLYVTTVRHGNFLFENDGTGRFRDITDSSGTGYEGHSSASSFFDYDRDGLLDLYLCNVGVYTTNEVGALGYQGCSTPSLATSNLSAPSTASSSTTWENAGFGTSPGRSGSRTKPGPATRAPWT
jgi:hypothetical protein